MPEFDHVGRPVRSQSARVPPVQTPRLVKALHLQAQLTATSNINVKLCRHEEARGCSIPGRVSLHIIYRYPYLRLREPPAHIHDPLLDHLEPSVLYERLHERDPVVPGSTS